MASHTRTGMAAFLFAIALALTFFGYQLGGIILIGLDRRWEAWENAFVWVVIVCSLFLAVGIPLGIMALRQEGTSKRLPAVALALQALVGILFVGIFWWLESIPTRIKSIRVIEQGRYERIQEKDLTWLHLVQSTDTIQALPGAQFGLRYVLVGTPKGRPVEMDVIWRFPPPGAWDSAQQAFRPSAMYHRRLLLGDTIVSSYRFDHPWELKAGPWVYELWFRNHKLITRTFTVQPSAP